MSIHRKNPTSRVKHAVKFAAPSRYQLAEYNFFRQLDIEKTTYQTGPRRGQEIAELRK